MYDCRENNCNNNAQQDKDAGFQAGHQEADYPKYSPMEQIHFIRQCTYAFKGYRNQGFSGRIGGMTEFFNITRK